MPKFVSQQSEPFRKVLNPNDFSSRWNQLAEGARSKGSKVRRGHQLRWARTLIESLTNEEELTRKLCRML